MKPASPEAYRLMHEGSIALADVERNGMRIDVDYLDRMIDKVGKRVDSLSSDLRQSEVWAAWKKTFRDKANLGSREQLGTVLFDVLRYPCSVRTASGRPSTDEAVLEKVDHPFIVNYLQIAKLTKLRTTNLIGIKRELVDGILRPSFNLHLVITYRSSSSGINFQNIPVRDPLLGKLVRRAFIPRDGFVLTEIDLKANEVRVAACYHKDPTMVQYILDDYDLHKDMAAECYLLDKADVSKPIRQMGKNGFVFPSFYGDWYKSIAVSMWEAIDRENLKLTDGSFLRDYLDAKGIIELGACDPAGKTVPGTFEAVIQKVEDRFWHERFPVYDQWRRDWYARYLKNGWFPMKTGFISQGIFKKNEVINSPVQGAAFHALLWVLIELNKWLKENRMKSMIIGTIHDSIELDIHKSEFQDVAHHAMYLIKTAVQEEWPWLIVPLAGEVEASEVNWWEKKSVVLS